MAVSLDAVAAALTTAVAWAMGISFGWSQVQRPHTYKIWWSIAFLVTGCATVIQLAAFLDGGFTPVSYAAYVVLAAAVPGLMGTGSLYLLLPRVATAFAIVIVALVAMTGVGVGLGPTHALLLGNVMRASQEVTHVLPGPLVVLGFAVIGSLGGAALVLGALWSWWKTRQSYNLAIAFGGIVFSLADTLAAYGIPGLFYGAELAGILVLYWAVGRSRVPAAARSGSVAPGSA